MCIVLHEDTFNPLWLSNRMVALEVKGVEFYTKKGLTWFVMNVETKGIEIARRNASLDPTASKYRPHISMYVK